MCFSSGGGSGDYAEQQRKDEQARQQRIRTGMGNIDKAFEGFDDNFYNKQSQNYLDYANPQLSAQYGQAQNNLAYNLARSGLTASSEAARNAGELQRQYNVARADIEGNAINAANSARKNVEGNRSELVSQLQATSDPAAAASQAIARAGYLANQQSVSPLGILFQNTTSLLGNSNLLGYKTNPYQSFNGNSASHSSSASRIVS